MMCLWISLNLSNLGFTELPTCVGYNFSLNLGPFQPFFLSLNTFSPLSPASWYSHYACICALTPSSSEALFISHFFCSLGRIISIDLSWSSVIISSTSSNLWLSFYSETFQLVYFSTPEFSFGSFKKTLLLYDIIYLIQHCHHTFLYFFQSSFPILWTYL